jgi:hypothetical protein
MVTNLAEARKQHEQDDDFFEALEQTEVKKAPAKKKSDMPVLEDAPAEVKEAVDEVNNAKADKKAAEARIKAADAIVTDYVKPIQHEDGFEGDFHNSYKVKGNETELSYVASNKFSINTDDEKQIKELLGEHYDNMIEKDRSMYVLPKVLKNAALQKELLQLIGKENFAKFFGTSVSLKVKKGYIEKRYNVVGDTDGLVDLDTFVKPAKASLK